MLFDAHSGNQCLVQGHEGLLLFSSKNFTVVTITFRSLIFLKLISVCGMLLIFKCCDLGYHASLNRALRTYLSAEYNLETSRHEGLDIIENAVDNLEPRSDKQRFMEMYPAAFCPPMKFEFQSHMGDEVSNYFKTNELSLHLHYCSPVATVVRIPSCFLSPAFAWDHSVVFS